MIARSIRVVLLAVAAWSCLFLSACRERASQVDSGVTTVSGGADAGDAGKTAHPVDRTPRLPGPSAADEVFQIPLGDSPSAGPAGAAVTAVLFADLTDGSSGRLFARLQALRRARPEAFRWVFKHYPSVRPGARGMEAAVVATLAADRGRFEAFAGALFEVSEGPGIVDRERLMAVGRQVGLGEEAMRAALESSDSRKRVVADRRLAARLAVRAAPALFLNGRRVEIGGRLGDEEYLRERVDLETDRATALLEKGVEPEGLYEALTRHGRKSAWMTIARPSRPERFTGAGSSGRHDGQTVMVDAGQGAALGPAGAPVTLTMFGELSCSFCGQMLPLIKRLHRKYPRRLRITVRHLPDRRKRPNLLDAAVLLEAVSDDERYWDLASKVYAEPGGYDRERLLGWAGELKLEPDRLRRRLEQPGALLERLNANRQEALEAGVRGSPYLFINGRPIPGATSLGTLDRMVAEEIERLGAR